MRTRADILMSAKIILLILFVAVSNAEADSADIAASVNVHIARDKFAVADTAELMNIVVDSDP